MKPEHLCVAVASIDRYVQLKLCFVHVANCTTFIDLVFSTLLLHVVVTRLKLRSGRSWRRSPYSSFSSASGESEEGEYANREVQHRSDWKGSLEGWWVQKGSVGLAFLP